MTYLAECLLSEETVVICKESTLGRGSYNLSDLGSIARLPTRIELVLVVIVILVDGRL